MADSVRAIGWAPEVTIGTLPTITAGANFVEEFTPNDNNAYDEPKFKTNKRWMMTKVIAKTRTGDISIRGRVSTAQEFKDLLASAMGVPTSGVYKAGTASSTVAGNYLGVKFAEGLAQSWTQTDARINTLEMALDAANGTFTYTAGLVGPAPVLAGPWTPTYTTPPGDLPFGAWQVVCKQGATAVCLYSFTLTLNNNLTPIYCTPLVDPTGSTVAGLSPTRYADGEAAGTFRMTYSYTVNAGSSYADFQSQTTEDWHITATEPVGPASMVIDIPIVAFTQGQIDRTQPDVRQTLTGTILYDSTSATGVTITFA